MGSRSEKELFYPGWNESGVVLKVVGNPCTSHFRTKAGVKFAIPGAGRARKLATCWAALKEKNLSACGVLCLQCRVKVCSGNGQDRCQGQNAGCKQWIGAVKRIHKQNGESCVGADLPGKFPIVFDVFIQAKEAADKGGAHHSS